MTVDVSVVVCAYTEQRWAQLLESLRSVREQEEPPAEVVCVVDNNPSLAERLHRQVGTEVLVVPNENRRGLSGARNTGTAASSGEVVAFLDDDAWADRGWSSAHARHYVDPQVVGVGGLVVPSWTGQRPRWFPDEFAWVVGCTYVGHATRVQPIRNPIGANMSFRRGALTGVGGFSEELGRVGSTPLGCEETEVSIRITRASPGARIMFEPGAVVHHNVAAARTGMSYFARRCWGEGVSKAHLARLAGAGSGLSSERDYVRKTLPSGVGRRVRDAVRAKDVWPLAQAGAVLSGLAVTTAGYAVGRAGGPADLKGKGDGRVRRH